MSQQNQNENQENEEVLLQEFKREAVSYFNKFDRNDRNEVIKHLQTNWYLSTDDFKNEREKPKGVISDLNPGNSSSCVILIPEEEGLKPLDYREIHQIIRELMYGIYILNQSPKVNLEANYDQTSTIKLPPAYLDTRIGQVLSTVDYTLKCLWHGAYFPKDKRAHFNERWKSHLDTDSSSSTKSKKMTYKEFYSAGIQDVTYDPEYGSIYDGIEREDLDDKDIVEERNHFMKHVEQLSMQMTFYQNKTFNHKDLYVMDSDWLVSSIVKALDDHVDKMTHTSYERINTRLQLHEELIMQCLDNKNEIRRMLLLCKFISFLTPFFMGMKKRMKIPQRKRLLPDLTGDECRTERELPPLILGPDFKCPHFDFGGNYFNLHGGVLVDIETDPIVEAPESFSQMYNQIMTESEELLSKHLSHDKIRESYKVPVYEINGKRYYAVMLEFETYYSATPQKPLWVKAYSEHITMLKTSKIVNDPEQQLNEQLRKYFGYRKTVKIVQTMTAPKAAIQKGLLGLFIYLCNKNVHQPSRLNKQDEQGLSLLHHAAINNHPEIIVALLKQKMDMNVRRNNISTDADIKTNSDRHYLLDMWPTALHFASRCGALDSATCLVGIYAGTTVYDQDGWAPVHYSAFFDHKPIIKMFHRHSAEQIDMHTKNKFRSTPLLLAASSGALSAVKCLIQLGAEISRKDSEDNGIVHLAALRLHTNVLEYLIESNYENAPVWKILVSMLKETEQKKDSAVKCLDVLSTSKPGHWKAILEADAVPALVLLMYSDNEELQAVAASVLCNISQEDDVRVALTESNAAEILIKRLMSPNEDIQSRSAIILSDIAYVEGNQSIISDKGGIEPLVELMDSEGHDVLVNAVNAVRVLCDGNEINQNAIAECGGIPPLVEFLTLVNFEMLQAVAASAVASVAAGNPKNQEDVIKEGAAKPLVDIVNSLKKEDVKLKAAKAIEALSDHNPKSQQAFIDLGAQKALLKILKNQSVEVKEQAACALWALAGQTKTQQKKIAKDTGITNICGMLLDTTESIVQVGCRMAISLGREDIDYQNQLANTNAFEQLNRLLQPQKYTKNVILMAIKVLGILCVGVATTNNKVTQKRIAEERTIPTLVNLLNDPLNDPTGEVQVEVAMSLGCIVLSNPHNHELLRDIKDFSFDVLLDLLKYQDEEIRLRAGMALAIFAFNNTQQQFAIREAGGISYSVFQDFLESENENYVCEAAFQIVVLARVIVDDDQVTLTARGVTILVNKVKSHDDNVVVRASSLLASLAHTRAGIPDAMVTVGAIDILVERLASANDQVRSSTAIALGYLTFNKTAARILLSACRNTPGLYKKMMENIGKTPKISEDFLQDFKRAKIVGLPSQCLEINGGPPVKPPSRRDVRPTTAHSIRTTSSRAQSGRKKSPVPSVIISKSTENSRPSTGVRTNSRATNSRARPLSAASSTKTRKTSPSPETSFKTRLSAWKNEK
ncbi:ankyrin and armadillo repeat-containing protein-like isoform X1 [Mytilus galloprovincialis]|uniref:ankyrin and armadillo repeat-containing protein-like isoform X1 n=1 Tax=Mytilus galloprovincialis TaxID=29158 RepID=UPI003F7CC8EC